MVSIYNEIYFWLDAVAGAYFLATFFYFRFVLSRKDTTHSAARSTRLRSPQILWLFFALTIVLAFFKNASAAVAYAICPLYWGGRFGALRVFFAILFTAFSTLSVLSGDSILSVLGGAALGAAAAFTVDMAWNWDLKRRGIVV